MPASVISGQVAVGGLSLGLLWASGLLSQGVALSAVSQQQAQQPPANIDSIVVDSRPLKLTPHQIVLSKTKKFNLYLPTGFEITVAAQGLRRARFMAKSHDG